MKIRTVYPTLTRRSRIFLKIRHLCKYLFLLAGLVSAITNLVVRGKPWSIIVIWSLISIWSLIFEPDAFELNFISVIAKALFYVVVLLALIDICLTSAGWALFVIPIVVFSAQIAEAVLFVIDIRQSMRNSMPVIWLMIDSLVAMAIYFGVMKDFSWPVIVMGSVSAALLIVCICFNKAFVEELRKRFHTR